LAFLVVTACALPAYAHPHVLIDAQETLNFDASGKLASIDHVWQFDEAFSAFATQGLDANNDGKLDQAELQPLAKVNVDSLSQFAFFSYLSIDGKNIDFNAPTKYHLEFDGTKLTLFYTLPLKIPVTIATSAALEVFDPEYFVAFTLTPEKVASVKAPAGCTTSLQLPHPLDAQTMAILTAIPVDQQVLPDDLRQKASVLANVVNVNCARPAKPVASPPKAAAPPGDGASAAPTSSDPGSNNAGLSSADIAKIAAAEAAKVAAGTFGQ
jgi:ABC-type uncharacterized transport system substrate-binding protein